MTSKTIVASFEAHREAVKAGQHLLQIGFGEQEVAVVQHSAETMDDEDSRGFWNAVKHLFGPSERPLSLVIVRSNPLAAETAAAILRRHNPLSIERQLHVSPPEPLKVEAEPAPVVGRMKPARRGRPRHAPTAAQTEAAKVGNPKKSRRKSARKCSGKITVEADSSGNTRADLDIICIEDLDREFRSDYEEQYAQEEAYDYYMPAYSFGRDLAARAQYRYRDWDEIEPEVRRAYEEHFPGLWNRHSEAVHTGFEKTRVRLGRIR